MVWLGTPCSGFSRARRGPPGGCFPCALRSREHLFGLPGLPLRERQLVITSNLLAQRSAAIQRLCIQLEIPGGEENPASSFLWELPSRQSIRKHPSVQAVQVDYCSCGCPFRARTRLHFWHAADPVQRRLSKLVCHGRGICDYTGRPHERLSGTRDGRFMTGFKSAYPKKLAGLIGDRLRMAAHAKWDGQYWPGWLQW